MKLQSLMSGKTKTTDASIGLDIGHSYIKMVNLRKESDDIFLDNFYIHCISGDIPALLKKMISECNSPTNKVNISISGKSTLVRDLWMPHMNHHELMTSLGYELDQYVPFPVEDIYYDSYILDESPLTCKNGQMRVVLAVANKKFVDERLQWLKDAGLEPNLIDADAINLYNLFQQGQADNKTVGLVDIGSSKTIIDIASDNVLTFTREIEYGTIKVKEWAGRGLSINLEEAEKLICGKDTRITGWVQDLVNGLSKELWSSFEYHEGQEQRSVEKVYITGGGSLLPGISDLLNQSIGVPVEVWNPLGKIKINLDETRKSEFLKTVPLFSIAIGLAYRSLW